MVLYGFVLGRKYLLSLVELLNVLPQHTSIVELQPEILIVSLPKPLDKPQQMLDRLGGTQQIIEIFAEYRQGQEDNLGRDIAEYLQQIQTADEPQASHSTLASSSTKLLYSLSAFSIATPLKQILKKLLTETKNILSAQNFSSRYVNKNAENPHSAVLVEEKLVEKQTALAVIEGKFKTFLGKIIAIQDFADYSYRDYKRPARDAKLGMLPPKLAQIMVNLTGLMSLYDPVEKLKSFTLYDPFAGVGTVLTEALRTGYSVIGSDIKPEVIQKAEKNIDWTRQRYFTHGQNVQLFIQDATTLTPEDLPEKIDAIVTETYLGPPLSSLPPLENLRKNLRSLEELLFRFLRAAAPLLPSGAPLVFITPVYRLPEGYMHLEAIPQLANKFGYQLFPLIPKKIRQSYPKLFAIDQSVGEHSLVYDRADQLVGREVWKLMKR